MTVTEPDDEAGFETLDGDPPYRRPWARFAPAFLWLLVIAWLAYAFIRVFGLETRWPGYTLIAFTPYVAGAAIVPLVTAILMRRRYAAIVAAVAMLALIFVIVPRMVGRADPAQGPEWRLMSSNMKFGGADPATIVRLVRDHHIDMLALEEYTPQAQRALAADGLDKLLPYQITAPRPSAAGSAIYSRYPLSSTAVITGPDWFTQVQATVAVPGAQPVLMQTVHPPAPASPSDVGAWRTTLDREPRATPKGPVRLLIGDFNATLDHAILRDLISSGYHDAADRLGDGLATTWPYDGTPVPPVTLDHALVDPRIGVSSFSAVKVPNTDHRAILVTVTLPKVGG